MEVPGDSRLVKGGVKRSVFKGYLRQLIRQLKALKKAEEEGNTEEVRRIIDELIKDAQDGLEDD